MHSSSNKLNLIVGRNIRIHRQNIDFSQEELASKCELHRTYIGAVERGERNITLNTLFKISVALKIPAIDLLKE